MIAQNNIQNIMNDGLESQHANPIKIIIIGKISVGKSCLLLKYVNSATEKVQPTIGLDSRIKKLKLNGKEYTLQLWDTAGHERYRTIVYNYFQLSQAVVVVFDLSDENSLDEAKIWLQQAVIHCGQDVPKIILANKCDIYKPNELQGVLDAYRHKIELLKKQFNCQFFAVSAVTGEGIDKSMSFLVAKALSRSKEASLKQTIKLNPIPAGSKKLFKAKTCC